MNITSKNIVISPNRYLTAFKAPPKGLSPHARADITLCNTDRVPPVISQRILNILHPSVLFLLIL